MYPASTKSPILGYRGLGYKKGRVPIERINVASLVRVAFHVVNHRRVLVQLRVVKVGA